MNCINEFTLAEMVQRLVAEFAPEQIILFGSHAWGTPTADSDIDLCVIVSENSAFPLEQMKRAYRAMQGLRVAKDIIIRTREQFEASATVVASLDSQIKRKGKVLYDRAEATADSSVA
jgi:uncharacterized protein